MRRLALISALLLVYAPSGGAGMSTRADSDVAALQVALRAAGVYAGTIDGLSGLATTRAVVAFQKKRGLVPDGVAGPRTRRALGHRGGPNLGARSLSLGMTGWDVAELQFLLATHGFPSGAFDGSFGPHLDAALRRFQRFEGLPQVGIAGPATRAALAQPPPSSPLALSWPLRAPLGDGFGPRGSRFHAGLDLQAAAGVRVGAARAGRVVWAAPRGSFGTTVVLAHGRGVRTLYAHLSVLSVTLGERVRMGEQIGLVGSTGRASGPHLHFEVRVRGAAVDPLSALTR